MPACICCRGEISFGFGVRLCTVCRPWNSASQVAEFSIPGWQRMLEQEMPELLAQAADGSLPMPMHDAGWAALLHALAPRDVVRPDGPNSTDLARAWELEQAMQMAGSNLLAVGGDRFDTEITDPTMVFLGRIRGRQVSFDYRGLRIENVAVPQGPGRLLLQALLTESGPVTHRFIRLHGRLTGAPSAGAQRRDPGRDRLARALRGMVFQPVGDADAPLVAALRSRANGDPPMCDWDDEGYMLIVADGEESRLALRLPYRIDLLERFLGIWRGRGGTRAAMMLRAVCLVCAQQHGAPSDRATISPHERSFAMLRSVVDGNARIEPHHSGLAIIGMSGVLWTIHPGAGAHGAPYVVGTTHPNHLGNPRGMRPICVFDGREELPLGDRIAAQCLSLLNDEAVGSRIPQIAEGIHIGRRLRHIAVREGEKTH